MILVRRCCFPLLLSFLLAAPVVAVAGKAQKGKGRAAKKGRGGRASSGPPLPPPQIDLQSLDLSSGLLQVSVSGSLHAPESRFFTMTDERKRRIVPSLVECRPETVVPGEDGDKGGKAVGMWQCSIGIPRIYQRSTLVDVSVELRGQTVSVPGDKVRTAWAEARAKTPQRTVAERPREPGAPWAAPRRPPDGGPTLDTDGTDPESEEE